MPEHLADIHVGILLKIIDNNPGWYSSKLWLNLIVWEKGKCPQSFNILSWRTRTENTKRMIFNGEQPNIPNVTQII